jgi:hypothetical protein
MIEPKRFQGSQIPALMWDAGPALGFIFDPAADRRPLRWAAQRLLRSCMVLDLIEKTTDIGVR